MAESDFVLSADYGLPLDEESARSISLVGFDGEDDVVFIGFDHDQAPPSDGRAAPQPAGRRQSLSDGLRGAAAAAKLVLLAALWRLRFWLIGTQLKARRTRTAVIMLGAVLLSVGCGLVLRGWLPARQAERTAEAVPIALPIPAKSVLVARVAIPRGRLLRASDLSWQPWPPGSIKKSYIELGTRNLPDLYGYVARQPFAEGEPISDSDIIAPGDHGVLAALLPPGMRAVSVDIREETAASGLIMPGDDVDVLLAVPVPALDQTGASFSAESRHAVEAVLSNIRVLAIDQRLEVPVGRAIIGSTATLEVTPKQAEIITLADDLALEAGNLRLTLRSLVPDSPEVQSSRSPGVGSPRSYMVESDISKLFPERKTAATAPRLAGRLTIVRRNEASVSQPGS